MPSEFDLLRMAPLLPPRGTLGLLVAEEAEEADGLPGERGVSVIGLISASGCGGGWWTRTREGVEVDEEGVDAACFLIRYATSRTFLV